MTRITNVSPMYHVAPLWKLLALLFATGCAAPGPRQNLRQGIPVAPRAPAFNPVTDAPITTGQPGYTQPSLPRSPHARVLPQTPGTMREAGVWSAEEPHAGPGQWDMSTIPLLRGVELPFPGDADTYAARVPTLVCADTMSKALVAARQHVRFDNLSPDARKHCVAANLYLLCTKALLEMRRAASAANISPSAREEIPSFQAALWSAQAFMTKSCGTGTRPPEDVTLESSTYAAWFSAMMGRKP